MGIGERELNTIQDGWCVDLRTKGRKEIDIDEVRKGRPDERMKGGEKRARNG
jgi:hypothetical protein